MNWKKYTKLLTTPNEVTERKKILFTKDILKELSLLFNDKNTFIKGVKLKLNVKYKKEIIEILTRRMDMNKYSKDVIGGITNYYINWDNGLIKFNKWAYVNNLWQQWVNHNIGIIIKENEHAKPNTYVISKNIEAHF